MLLILFHGHGCEFPRGFFHHAENSLGSSCCAAYLKRICCLGGAQRIRPPSPLPSSLHRREGKLIVFIVRGVYVPGIAQAKNVHTVPCITFCRPSRDCRSFNSALSFA